jgi:predicted ester cyclase
MSEIPDAGHLAATAFDQVWRHGDVEAIDGAYDDDYAVHFMGEENRLVGPDALGGYVGHLHDAFPDLAMTVEDRLVDGDRVTTRWAATGTHKGEHMGLPPTSAEVDLSGVVIDRVDESEDEIAESWIYLALPAALRQHGIEPHGTGRDE